MKGYIITAHRAVRNRGILLIIFKIMKIFVQFLIEGMILL